MMQYDRQGNFIDGEKHIKAGLAIQRQLYNDKNIKLSWTFSLLGNLYHKNKDYFKAKYYFQLASWDTKEDSSSGALTLSKEKSKDPNSDL